MNKNANVAAVIRLTRATKKAQRKKTLYLEGLQWKWDVLELQTSINSRLIQLFRKAQDQRDKNLSLMIFIFTKTRYFGSSVHKNNKQS